SVLAEILRAGNLPASVRTVNLAGEPLPRRLVQQLYGLKTVERVFNLYGPTEATVYATWASIEPDREEAPPIGRPIANTQLYVLDRHLQPVPVGVPGELHIGGVGLARGYLNRPNLTAEQFIQHPFSTRVGDRLYKTGDLVRYRPDGTLEFLGRLDDQVKVRGFRIELGEIEATLDQHPDIRTSVVVAREDVPGDVRLVAYIVPAQQPAPGANELRRFLTAKLPDYMVPAVFIPLGTLPLTSNGKVDRRALPVPDQRSLYMEQGFVASRNAVERRLAREWEQVLGIHPIGARDGFFELGGHSLLAVRLFAQIERAFGRRLPLSSLFQAKTIEAQARLLSQEETAAAWTSLVPIQPDGTRPPFFCVHAHEGHVLYFRYLAAWLGPDQPFYGLQARELDGVHPPHTCVEDMAAQYIQEIQSLQPEGPYYLGANCGGGLVAFEMAQQLHAQGQEVDLLALIDAHAPGCHVPLPHAEAFRYRAYRLLQKLDEHWGNLALLDPQEQLAYLGQAVRWLLQSRLRPMMQQITARFAPGNRSSLPSAPGQVISTQPSVLNDYIPRFYPGRVALFRPSKQAARYRHDPQFGWGRLAAGGVEVHVLPGYHGIIHEPRVRLLAQRLQACLANAQTPLR
ncbi:MAG: AMP-binding protein, partial [Candidatus Entotheonellia bacterium]